MQFRVPQFIDVEDKLFGPFTFKQFVYILGALGFAFLIWTFVPIRILAILLIIPISGLFLALAFVRINNRPFVDFLESAVKFFTSAKIYTWKQPKPKEKNAYAETITQVTKETVVSKVEHGRLHDIAFGLDVYDRGNSQENK
jgi:hypothetical protein